MSRSEKLSIKNIGLGIVRLIVGGLFIFSGLIKLNDPQGTAIKLHEYFEVFSTDIAGFFMVFAPIALPIAIVLSALEVILGVAVLINFKMKLTSWTLLGLIVFFTFLTFYSAYFNKVTDCGCFGDAIKLTPWESFTKDIFLTILIAILFFFRKGFTSMLSAKVGNIAIGVTTVLSLWMAFYAVAHLPYLDFRAYAIGESIPANLKPAEEPVYGEQVYTYLNKKSGADELSNAWEKRWSDTSLYKFVSYDRPLLNEAEATPRIPADFVFMNMAGEDNMTQLFTGKKLLMVSYDWEGCKKDEIRAFKDYAKNAASKGITVWINSNQVDKMSEFCAANDIAYEVFSNDATIIKTMVRSNPGALYLEDGVVKGKWHYNDFDDIERSLLK